MGRGIAYVGAVGGYAVTVVDINESALQNAKKEINHIIEKGLVTWENLLQNKLNKQNAI